MKQLRTYTEAIGIKINNESLLEELYQIGLANHERAQKYQIQLLQIFKTLWTNFDYYSIATGVCLLTVSVILLISVTNLIPSIVVNQMVPEFAPWIVIMSLTTNVCFHGFYYVFPVSYTHLDVYKRQDPYRDHP